MLRWVGGPDQTAIRHALRDTASIGECEQSRARNGCNRESVSNYSILAQDGDCARVMVWGDFPPPRDLEIYLVPNAVAAHEQ